MNDEPEAPLSPRRRRRKPTPPTVIPLTSQRDNRESLTLFRPEQDFAVATTDRIVILPGSKGFGWVLKVYHDPEN